MNDIIIGDALTELKKLPEGSVQCCVTSPPYWQLRDYKIAGQLGLEPTPEKYVGRLCDIFDEVGRVLRQSGSCFVVLGDTYGTVSGAMRNGKFGVKNTNAQQMTQPAMRHKSLLQIPSRFAIEMFNRGWILRNEIIWHKPNVMPDPTDDRFTVDFEKIFFFTKKPQYYFEQQFEPYTKPLDRYGGNRKKLTDNLKQDSPHATAHRERDMRPNPEGKNKRCVWSINTESYPECHCAVYPNKIPANCIKAGSKEGDTILDPFAGSGTTAEAAHKLNRQYIMIELNPEYIPLIEKRLAQQELFNQPVQS